MHVSIRWATLSFANMLSFPLFIDAQVRAEPEGANSSPTPSPTSPTFATRKITANGNANATSAVAADRPLRNGSVPLADASDTISNSDYIDTKTPYISRIIEQKSGKSGRLIKQTNGSTQEMTNKNEVSYFVQ